METIFQYWPFVRGIYGAPDLEPIKSINNHVAFRWILSDNKTWYLRYSPIADAALLTQLMKYIIV